MPSDTRLDNMSLDRVSVGSMPPETSVAKVIGKAILQIVLLPLNFLSWLVTSPELITLLCILSEILIELVVSAVMAGVSIIVSAVILMEDDPQPALIMTPPSQPKKSFLHGGDSTCITDWDSGYKDTKEKGAQAKVDEDEDRKSADRKSIDNTRRSTSASTRSILDRWLPKYGAPRGDEVEIPLVEGSEPETATTQDTDGDESARSAESEQPVTEDGDLGGEVASVRSDSVKSEKEPAGSIKTDIEPESGKNDTESENVVTENVVSERGSGSQAAQDRLSVASSKTEK